MDTARKFVEKNQIDKAVKEYLRIVQEDPKDVRVWLKIGDLYAKKGAKQDATDTYLKVARFYHEQGFFLKAVAVYKQILKLDPRLVDVILKLAELYRQLGIISDAMQHYESVAAHFHREGNTKEALETVKKLVDLDPDNIATRIKLAELYSKEELNQEAVEQFTIACETLRRQARQDDFIKVAERLLWHKPDNHALNRELAGLYLRRNDPRRALQKLQACFKADPRDVETLGLLAQAFQALEQKAKTVSVLKELARVHVENKSRDKAGSVYRKILEFVPNDSDAIQFLGPSSAAPVAAAPPPPQPMRPPPPTPRPSTPMPEAIRMATHDAQFNITGDLPALPASARMTGAMPLVDEQSLSGVDFAVPEYDDADFSADMEPPPDPRSVSAAGERHAEEISKILAETDVYVKYGLHQKAVDHLRRVFTLDPENVEARERLKDIFVSQGREQEAEVELLKLAETVAASDPDRAEAYLQELLAMNGTHTGAFELARRFRLRVARMSSVSAEGEYQGGGVAAVDVDLDELELSGPPGAMAVARGRSSHRDSVDDFDPDELIGHDMAHGSPAPSRPPMPQPHAQNGQWHGATPQPHEAYEDNFDLEFEPSPSQATRQMSPEQAEALAALPEDELDDPVIVDHSPAGYHHDELDDPEDLPFDPDAARAFDAAVHGGGVSGFEETAQPSTVSNPDGHTFETPPQYDLYGTEAVHTPPYDETQSQTIDGGHVDLDQLDDAHPRAESMVEDELDEADFYAGQGMYPEARDMLVGMLVRYPNHPLITTKLRDLDALIANETPHEPEPGESIEVAQESIEAEVEDGGTDAIDLDEIEEVSPDDLEEIESERSPPKKRKPTVMLEKPLDEGDADTHYDLGLAYKEMGLYDEAVKAFEKVLRAPGREVQCRVMIGMCLREQGNPSEAIHQFKQGLHAEPSERERLSLYYEIGVTYEVIGDVGEALYYFESVTKRDPGFADAAMRADQLRQRGGHAAAAHDDDI